MKKQTTVALTHELFQLMRQMSGPKIKHSSIDGLTRSEYKLLVTLATSLRNDKQTFTVTEISSLLQITPAGVTHLINPLEEAGHLERLQDRGDRRIVRIRLTEKGTQVTEALISEVQENLMGLVNYLGEEDCKRLIRLMSKMVAYFRSQSEN